MFLHIRSEKKYKYESLITGEIQDDKPLEEEDEENIEHVKESEHSPQKSSKLINNGKDNNDDSNVTSVVVKSDETKDSYNVSAPLPLNPYPPLPPIPGNDSINLISTECPPLPLETNPVGEKLTPKPPPPPPEPDLSTEQIEPNNQTSNQVRMIQFKMFLFQIQVFLQMISIL